MLNSIKDLKQLGGHEVRHLAIGDKMSEDENPMVIVDHEKDTITFKMMTKPASKGGKGVQHYDLVKVAKLMVQYLDKDYPCGENTDTLLALNKAIASQEKRTADRIRRKVEGKYEH